jgi:AcrR family transcriptional regulator
MVEKAAISRKDAERESRKQYILEATRRLLNARGIEHTSMDDIAAAVDYTRRTLYVYFSSRDEILLLVLCEAMATRWKIQQEAVATARTGLARILTWGEAFFKYARQNPHAMDLHIYWDFKGIDRARISEESFVAFEEINDELAEALRGYFRLGVKDRSLRPDLDIDMSISQYLYTLRAVIHRALSDTYTFAPSNPEAYFHHYLDLFSRAIRNTKGRKI